MNSQIPKPIENEPPEYDVPNAWGPLIPMTVVADIIVTAAMISDPGPFFVGVFIGLVAAQVSLVCCWLIFGRHAWARRAVAFFVVLAVCVVLLLCIEAANSPTVSNNVVRGSLLAIGLPMGTILLSLALVRFFGISPSRPPSMKAARNEMRFSVRRLFGWTTFFAVASMLAAWIGPDFFVLSSNFMAMLFYMLNIIAMTTACVVSCWGMKNIKVATLLAYGTNILITIGAICIILLVISKNSIQSKDIISIFISTLTQTTCLNAWLIAWRVNARQGRENIEQNKDNSKYLKNIGATLR